MLCSYKYTSLIIALIILALFILIGRDIRGAPTATLPPMVREAHSLSDIGRFEAANKLYIDYLNKNPDDVEAVHGLAVNLYVMQKYDEALPFQERASQLDRMDAQTRVELGLNYLGHQDRPLAAIAVLREAVRLEGSPRNRTLLARALMAAWRHEEAEEELVSVLAESPDYGYARSMLSSLRGRKGI